MQDQSQFDLNPTSGKHLVVVIKQGEINNTAYPKAHLKSRAKPEKAIKDVLNCNEK
jgi:hypothetical protein